MSDGDRCIVLPIALHCDQQAAYAAAYRRLCEFHAKSKRSKKAEPEESAAEGATKQAEAEGSAAEGATTKPKAEEPATECATKQTEVEESAAEELAVALAVVLAE